MSEQPGWTHKQWQEQIELIAADSLKVDTWAMKIIADTIALHHEGKKPAEIADIISGAMFMHFGAYDAFTVKDARSIVKLAKAHGLY